jgi:NADH dehydrogenase [ubiquinone] 1 alpha subcomplex assembly factor 1
VEVDLNGCLIRHERWFYAIVFGVYVAKLHCFDVKTETSIYFRTLDVSVFMKTILIILLMMKCTYVSAQWTVDFSSAEELDYWYRVNDSVMGGLSQSNLRVVDNIAYFEGELSLKNNGGFASVRRVGPVTLKSGTTPIIIQVSGDGRSYQLRLRTNKGSDGVAYVATFSSSADSWQTLTFNEQDFVAQFRGRIVSRAPALSFSDVRQIGFMLADKQAGSFQLAIKNISQ